MPYPKRKYRKGYTIFGMSELTYWLMSGKWIYMDDKAYHPGFIISMPYRTVIKYMEQHRISEAIDQKKEYYAKQQKEYLAKLMKEEKKDDN